MKPIIKKKSSGKIQLSFTRMNRQFLFTGTNQKSNRFLIKVATLKSKLRFSYNKNFQIDVN